MKTRKLTNPIGEGMDIKDVLDCHVIRKNDKVYVSTITFEDFLIPFKGIYNTNITFTANLDNVLTIKSESLAKTLYEIVAKNHVKDKIELLTLRKVLE